MYGMVNKAVEEMVVQNHGQEVWESIKAEAGVEVDVFMSNESYPDQMTYNLVAAASRILGRPSDDILFAFGEHWILHTAQSGYGGLMQAAGGTFPEFLRNLPNFHARVSMIFPRLKPPRFECTEILSQSLKLHYYSHRVGLEPFVIGLLCGLGKLFACRVHVEQIAFKQRGAEHDVFDVKWEPDPSLKS